MQHSKLSKILTFFKAIIRLSPTVLSGYCKWNVISHQKITFLKTIVFI